MSGEEGGGRVVVYSDYVCPFSYLAQRALARLRAEAGLELELRAYELRPAPVPMLDARDERLRAWWDRTVEPLARELGVEIRYPSIQPRTRKAHEAVALARELGHGDALHEALFRAFFVESRDIGRIDVLVEVGERVGLERTRLKVALDIDQYTDRVLADEVDALEHGVMGVPALRVDGRVAIGLRPYESLRAFVLAGQDG